MRRAGTTADQAERRADRAGPETPFPGGRPRHRCPVAGALGVAILTAGLLLPGVATAAAPGRTDAESRVASYAVAAQRQPLTTSSTSVVAHDTELEALVPHSGRLFAATGRWEYPGAGAHGQVLVKKSKTSPWTIFEKTQSLRVQALDSFPFRAIRVLGRATRFS